MSHTHKGHAGKQKVVTNYRSVYQGQKEKNIYVVPLMSPIGLHRIISFFATGSVNDPYLAH